MIGSEVVRAFHLAMQERDWERASALLAADIIVEWPATGERLTGARFLDVQRDYPEGWSITVLEVIGDARVASRVRVDHGEQVFLCAGFFDVVGGRIRRGVEHWVTVCGEGQPPWRIGYSDKLDATDLSLAFEVVRT